MDNGLPGGKAMISVSETLPNEASSHLSVFSLFFFFFFCELVCRYFDSPIFKVLISCRLSTCRMFVYRHYPITDIGIVCGCQID